MLGKAGTPSSRSTETQGRQSHGGGKSLSPPYTPPRASPRSHSIHSLFLTEEREVDNRNRSGNLRVTQPPQSEPTVTYSHRIWNGIKFSPGSIHTIQCPHLTHDADTREEIKFKRRKQKLYMPLAELVRFLFLKGNSLFLGDYSEIQQKTRKENALLKLQPCGGHTL